MEARRNSIHYLQSASDQPKDKFSCGLLIKFHRFLNKFFYKLGYRIAKNPGYFILIPIFLSLLGITGIQRLQYEKDPEYLFSPRDGLGREEREVVERLFPIDFANKFDPSRMTRLSSFARILVSARANDTVFRTSFWNDLVSLDEAIRNITVTWEGRVFEFEELCARMNEHCTPNLIFNLNDYIPEIENGSMQLNYPIMLFPLVLPFFYGGVVVNETEGVVISAEAIALNYFLREDTEIDKQRAKIWEHKVLDLVRTSPLEHIKTSVFVASSLEEELDNNAASITSYLVATVIVMILFSIFSVFMFDWVRSKLAIGILGVLSAAMATGCAFGFLMYCGVPFIGINMAAPFLMLGIGIDDMFVVLSAWQRTRIQDDVPTRLAETYSEAAVSITITSITNLLSFFIGAFTVFPSVQIFCLYIGTSIFFTYVWFITFYGGILALSGYRERKQKHIFTGKEIKAKSQAGESGCCYTLFCTGGINKDDPWNPKDNKKHILTIFFRDYFGKALTFPAVKALVICVFLIYLSGAIYGCLNVKEGLERRRLVLDDSYLIDFFDTEDRLFRKFPYRIQVVINDNVTYSDPEMMKDILRLHKKFEELPYIGSRLYTQSWMRGFFRFLRRQRELRENITDEASFIRTLKTHYLSPGSSESLDIVFNEDETRIIASRFVIQSYQINNTNEDKDMMQAVRKVAEEAPFNVLPFHSFFVYFDQFLLVRTTSIQTISLAAVVMMVVALIFIPNPLCCMWVAFSIISIEVGVIGYMSLWGVNLDSVSMINLIMCIGFSVDFSAHISYAFLTAKVSTPNERVRECLYTLGLPVLQGGLSTIVGVMILVFAPSYIFLAFFKIVFLVIFFGIIHGTLLLPVMLSLLGPGSCSKPQKEASPAIAYKEPEIIIQETKKPISQLQVTKEDSDSLDRDLGLGSSGSSSRSSLHDLEDANSPVSSDVENTPRCSARSEAGRDNDGFVPENEACGTEEVKN